MTGSVEVLTNDVHPDGGAITFVGHSNPTSGTVACDPVGHCTYTPNTSAVSGDQFTYTVRDSDGDEAIATVTVAAFNQFEEISSDGPLLYVDTGATLACAVEYEGDDLGSFFADFGCGTFLATGGTCCSGRRSCRKWKSSAATNCAHAAVAGRCDGHRNVRRSVQRRHDSVRGFDRSAHRTTLTATSRAKSRTGPMSRSRTRRHSHVPSRCTAGRLSARRQRYGPRAAGARGRGRVRIRRRPNLAMGAAERRKFVDRSGR